MIHVYSKHNYMCELTRHIHYTPNTCVHKVSNPELDITPNSAQFCSNPFAIKSLSHDE